MDAFSMTNRIAHYYVDTGNLYNSLFPFLCKICYISISFNRLLQRINYLTVHDVYGYSITGFLYKRIVIYTSNSVL